jgi:hypothetical protein
MSVYFIKRTTNAYDFGVLFDTPLVFPISWDHSKIDGFTGRFNIVERGGFSAFVVMAHTNAIFAGPGNGGLFVEPAPGEFRIDHDQKFNSTVNLQQVFERRAVSGGRSAGATTRAWSPVGTGLRQRARRSVRSAGRDRSVLRQHGRHSRLANRELLVVGPWGEAVGHSCRWHRRRRGESAAHCAPAHRGSRLRRDNLFHSDRAKVKLRLSVLERDEQGCAVQLSIDLHRNALRHATCLPGPPRSCLLG